MGMFTQILAFLRLFIFQLKARMEQKDRRTVSGRTGKTRNVACYGGCIVTNEMAVLCVLFV